MAMKLFYILAVICPVFGLIRTVWERRLIITRKCVSGTDGFSTTMIGTIVRTAALWQMKGSYIYSIIYVSVIITMYILIGILVKKEEYPEEERFTKE